MVWCPKRRKSLGDVEIREWIAETIRAIGEEFEFDIEELAVGDNHVHLFIGFPPRYSISRVVGIIKSISASRTFGRFPWLRKKYWSGELWEDGYGVRTVGDKVTQEIVKRYSRRHDEEATNQPRLF